MSRLKTQFLVTVAGLRGPGLTGTDIGVIEDAQRVATLAAGFDTRASLIAYTPNTSAGDRTSVQTSDTGTHAAVSGEYGIDGTAATPGDLIPNAGRYLNVSGVMLRVGNTDAQEAKRSETTASTAAATMGQTKLTQGEQPLTGGIGQALNGATLIAGPSGGSNYVGFNLPAGSSGQNTYVTSYLPFTTTQIAALTGRVLRFKSEVALSAGFMTNRSLNSFPINISTTGGATRTNQGTLVRNEVIGNVLYREATYTVVGDEARIGLVFQVNSTSTTGAHSLQISSLTWAYETAPAGKTTTANDEQLAAVLDARVEALGIPAINTALATKHFGFSDRLSEQSPSVQVFNGATARAGADGRNWGWTVPIGSTGTNSLVQARLDLQGLGALLAGRKVRVSFGCDTSASYTQIAASGTFQVTRGGLDVPANPQTQVSNVQKTTNRRVVEFEGTMNGTETVLKPYISRGTQSAAAAEQFLVVTDVVFEIVSSPSDTMTLMEENLRFGEALRKAVTKVETDAAIAAATTGGDNYAVTVTVKPSGGDYSHPAYAIAAITDASVSKKYRVLIHPGFYDGIGNIVCKDYVDLEGTNPETCHIHYELPDDVDPATIQSNQTMWITTETKCRSLRVTCRNARYPFHADRTGSIVLEDRTQRIYNCWVEHLGNDGARAYQTSIGGNPGAVWASENAWGHGSASGNRVVVDHGTVFKAPSNAFSTHTNTNFDKAATVDLRNARLITSGDAGNALSVQPLGSGRSDPVLVNNMQLAGNMRYVPGPWIQTTLDYQPANHAEIPIIGAGNSPTTFTITDFGRALKIESANATAASTVAVSGTAATALMGEVIAKAGVVGLKGYAYGKVDVSGTPVGPSANIHITSMGQRLGDCSTTAKTLSVSFQGGAAINVSFNENYVSMVTGSITGAVFTATAVPGRALAVGMVVGLGTGTPRTITSLGTGSGGAGTYNLSSAVSSNVAAGSTIPVYVSNATILASINTALGAAGTASLYAVGERYRPALLDEEKSLLNNSGVGIPMGSALAFDTTIRTVRLMTSTDPAARFVGIAWEDIYPGTSGRVKHRGYLSVADLLRTDSGSLAFGDTFSVDAAAPGKLYKGGSQGLMPAIRSDAVRFAGTI